MASCLSAYVSLCTARSARTVVNVNFTSMLPVTGYTAMVLAVTAVAR